MMRAILESMRPRQWIKNLFLFAAPIFGRAMARPGVPLRTAAAFGVFCALSGALYLANDAFDAEEDRIHPRKAARPVASGRLSPRAAGAAAAALCVLALGAALPLGREFFASAAAYALLLLAYSWRLKRVVILDVFIISAGFVIRVAAGGFVSGVKVSSWLLVCTTLISLLLALGKRRHELVSLEGKAPRHRSVLEDYSARLLDQMIAVVTAATAVAYALYTMAGETVRRFGSEKLLWTAPFVLYGIFRYLFLVYRREGGGSPEEMLVRDAPLLLDVLLWIAVAAAIIYL